METKPVTPKEKAADLSSRRAEMVKIKNDLWKLEEEYKAIQKSYFGITDGENANVLDLVNVIIAILDSE